MGLKNTIPTFKLYGIYAPWPTPDMVHCESIAARSKLHNWQIRPHQHHGLFQILYLKGGAAQIQLDDTQHDLTVEQVLTVPQMCIHGFQFSQDAVGHVVTVAYPLIDRFIQQGEDALVELNSPSIYRLGEDDESSEIRAAFRALDVEYQSTTAHRNLLIEFLLGSVLIRLARRSPQQAPSLRRDASRAGDHFGKFSGLIDDHFRQQKPVSYYAGLLGITPAHLNAVCRLVASKSALELIHERMLLEAKRNLIYTSMTIGVVAYAIGFTDPAYFTRFFKRRVGLSPKEFRIEAGQ